MGFYYDIPGRSVLSQRAQGPMGPVQLQLVGCNGGDHAVDEVLDSFRDICNGLRETPHPEIVPSGTILEVVDSIKGHVQLLLK